MKTLTLLLALACLLIAARGARAAEAKGPSAAQGEEILRELREIKQLLLEQRGKATETASAPAAPAAPGTVSLDAAPHDSVGQLSAPITLVEYTDYQCPFCKRFHERTWPELKKRYVDTGKVRFEVRDMPLQFHEQALPAAIAARCAGRQGKFWPVFETLLASPEALTAEGPRRAALAAGVAAPAFEACLRDPTVRNAIEADVQDAERIGVDGTPGFVIAQRRGDKLEGTLLLGAQSASVFAKRLDALLAAPRPH